MRPPARFQRGDADPGTGEQLGAFLDAYEQARGRGFTTEEREVAWAASLLPAVHNARGETLYASPPVASTALRGQASARLALAGA